MNNRILYFLGAGASADCIPVIKDLNSSFKEFKDTFDKVKRDYFKLIDGKISNDEQGQIVSALKVVESELDWLIDLSKNNSTIDDRAAEFFSKSKFKELERLKNILSFYFEGYQYINLPDKRYRQFINTSSVKNEGQLPNDISIFSWNYDIQFEINFGQIINETNIQKIHSQLNIINKGTYLRPVVDKFSILKLNGTAGFFHGEQKIYDSISTTLFEDFNIDSWIRVVRTFSNFKNRSNHETSSLSYSFEEPVISNKWTDGIVQITNCCRYLVVIGYSFPYLNLETDKLILNSLVDCNLVYILDKDPAFIESRIKHISPSLENCKFVHLKDVSTFPTPNFIRI